MRGQGLVLGSFAVSSPVKYVLARWTPHVLPCLKTHRRLILSRTHVGRRQVALSEAQKCTIFSSGCQSPLLSLFLQPLHHSLFPSWSLCVRTLLMIHVLIPLCQGPRVASITLRPCLLLALRALTLYLPPPQPHQKPLFCYRQQLRRCLNIRTRLKELFFAARITLNRTLPIIYFLFSLRPCSP